MTFIQACSYAALISLAIFCFKEQLVHLFTGDGGRGAVDVTLALSVIPLFSFTNMVDMCLSFFMGCVRALGI